MRIAIVAPPWFPVPPDSYGGIELMCYWLVEGLLARGHRVTLIGAEANKTGADFVSTYDPAPSARVGESFPEVIHAATVAGALKDLAPDVIHDNSLAGPLLAFNRSVPTIVTAHGPVQGELLHYYRMIGHAVSMVAISDAQRRLAPELPWIGTVHNALRVKEYPFVEKKDDFVLFLGRLNSDKGAHRAIDAARAAGYPIVLAAKCSEPEEKRFFEQEIRPRLGDGVEWIGEVDSEDKKDLLKRARCLVFPIEWHEPFGLVMIEALACGTPVVATLWGSVPEIVVDGVNGFVCDMSAFPEAIERCGDLDAQACRDHALEHFDVDGMVSGYEAVFEAVAE